MALRLKFNADDIAGFKLLFFLTIIYAIASALVYSVIHMKFITPLDFDAPIDRFSEARAVEHVRVLSHDIGGRQEGRPGLLQAADYIKMQLDMMKERADPNVRIEIEETTVNGSFNMKFLGHSIALAYRNHTNILMRISAVDFQETDPSVLVNAHFDTPIGSPGAGDCGSCVASMLELARLCIDSSWVPPRPVIFLFNGAEELFMLGSHGFMTTHRWRDTIGAFIDIEASGTGGSDLVVQSGPGSWPSFVYAQSAVYPMANSAAQDVFGAVPGDTDYRMFAQDCGDIPGLDIIFLLGGYFYHTSSDTVDRLLPGSIQARGDNLVSLVKAFSNSSMLRNAHERKSFRETANTSRDKMPVFFDYFSLFLVFYTRKVAVLLHSIPLIIFLLMPIFLNFPNKSFSASFQTFYDFIKGMLYQVLGVILAIVFPITFAVLRLLFTKYSMNWFCNSYSAFLMFVPCSLAGLLIPNFSWRNFPLSQSVLVDKSTKEELAAEARFWGAFGLYSFITLVYLISGLGGGFMTFLSAVFMFFAWVTFRLSSRFFGYNSLRATTCYVIPLVPCLLYSVYIGGFLAVFVMEKMGMTGSLPPPYGYFIPDIVVAATIGLATSWCIGPLLPVVSHWLSRSSVLQFLLHGSILAMALSSQLFPYSVDAPKRLIFQHTIRTDGAGIVDSSYDFAVVDSNSLQFVFKHAPEVAKELHITPELPFQTANLSMRETWLGAFPISSLFSSGLKFHAESDDILKQYKSFPYLASYCPEAILNGGSRRIYLEFSLGSLKEVSVAVLNITGPLSNWSFSNNILPASEVVDHGPPSYICRLSGASNKNWTFWLEARSSEPLRVEVAVLDQHLTESVMKLKGLFPKWIDVTTFSSFRSTYIL